MDSNFITIPPTITKPLRRAVLSKQSISRVLSCFRSGDYLSRRIVAYTLKRHNPKGRRATLNPFLFGLAPDGVYRAYMLPCTWCALTATVPSLPPEGGGLLFCGTIPYGHPRRPLAGILPYGARTFLKSSRLAIAFHTYCLSLA